MATYIIYWYSESKYITQLLFVEYMQNVLTQEVEILSFP